MYVLSPRICYYLQLLLPIAISPLSTVPRVKITLSLFAPLPALMNWWHGVHSVSPVVSPEHLGQGLIGNGEAGVGSGQLHLERSAS